MLNWIFKLRFGYLDLIWVTAMTLLIVQGDLFLGMVVGFVGAVITIHLTRWVHMRAFDKALEVVITSLEESIQEFEREKVSKDLPWQQAADAGSYVLAIQRHRSIYNSTLKDAKDVVDAYLATTPT